MKPMTEENLRAAIAGESQASVKYAVFANVAHKEGFPEIARLFKAISYAEQIHATNHLKALGEVKSTMENLQKAFGGEDFEIESMYPAYKAVAILEEEKKAEKSMNWAMEAEKDHRTMYQKAMDFLKGGKDRKAGNVWVCEICGHTHDEDHPPDKCPICGVGPDKYLKF